MSIQKTKYYDEFLHYFKLAKEQQEKCNLGSLPHEGSVDDDLMCSVKLYDVVERKYAGFTQILHDIIYNTSEEHPYSEEIADGSCSDERNYVVNLYAGANRWPLEDELYLFLVHRLTGSAINYAKSPSGYHNTILPNFAGCKDMWEMANVIRTWEGGPFYTSVGYQFPRFPKPPEEFKRGGDYFLCDLAPTLAQDLAAFLIQHAAEGKKPTFREVGDFMFEWNNNRGLVKYKFQYAAVLADIADFWPDLIDVDSLFYYGSNALECISLLATSDVKMRKDKLCDEIMLMAADDTGGKPYNLEDVACDFVRWMENYCKPGADYAHLDLDQVWNSSNIANHPKGRQEAMLKLGLVDTFNGMSNHPSDYAVLEKASVSVQEYLERCESLE